MQEFEVTAVTVEDHVLGRHDAPVTVLEYGDYECPFCRGAARDVHEMLGRYPDSVRFVFRNFPIAQLHPHAEQAAQAAEAAGGQGKFWPMYEKLLHPLSKLDLGSLLDCAADLDLDTERFRREVTSMAYTAKIERDVAEAVKDGVNATPKFYVAGQRIDGKLPLDGLEDAIRAAVRAATPLSAAGGQRCPQVPAARRRSSRSSLNRSVTSRMVAARPRTWPAASRTGWMVNSTETGVPSCRNPGTASRSAAP
jgi:predicted DsbA family dithiol-disulfide isomerase